MGILSYFKPSKKKEDNVAEEKHTSVALSVLTPLDSPVADGFARLRFEALGAYIYACQRQYLWVGGRADDDQDQGVVLKTGRDEFVTSPAYLKDIPNGFFMAVKLLNVKVTTSRICIKYNPIDLQFSQSSQFVTKSSNLYSGRTRGTTSLSAVA